MPGSRFASIFTLLCPLPTCSRGQGSALPHGLLRAEQSAATDRA